MKYEIETTENGCIETITLSDDRQYIKRHTKTGVGFAREEDSEFSTQMGKDGFCEEFLNDVYDLFDNKSIACDFIYIADLEN